MTQLSGPWLARTWPVSIPLVAVGVLFWLLPGWDLKLRYSGLALESIGLFIVARRLYLIREQFAAPTGRAVVVARWRERPDLFRRDATAHLTGQELTAGAGRLGAPLLLPGEPPSPDAEVGVQLEYLRDAVVSLRDTLGSIHGEPHTRIDGMADDGKRRAAELDQKLATATTTCAPVGTPPDTPARTIYLFAVIRGDESPPATHVGDALLGGNLGRSPGWPRGHSVDVETSRRRSAT